MPAKKEKLWLKMVKPWGGFKGTGEIVLFDRSKGMRRIADGVGVKASRAEVREAEKASARPASEPPTRRPEAETATANPGGETADATPKTDTEPGGDTADATPKGKDKKVSLRKAGN